MEELVYYYPLGHEKHFQINHPERPERVEAIVQTLKTHGVWDVYPKLPPIVLQKEFLQVIHREDYLEKLPRICQLGEMLDMDTYTTPDSWRIALETVGGAVAIAEAVWSQAARRGFALTRPPGHHATRAAGMGFCLLNNISLAAQYLIERHHVQRLAILDFDLHHGNGTQDIFWERKDVFYLSIHQSPLYPGSGALNEIGRSEGEGFTANFPLPPGSGDKAFQTILTEIMIPLLDGYHPEIILMSYGFDPHWRDPLGHLQLSAKVYGELIQKICQWADNYCQGRVAIFLEGGYDLEAAKVCSTAVVMALLGKEWQDPIGKSPSPESHSWQSVLMQAKQIWKIS